MSRRVRVALCAVAGVVATGGAASAAPPSGVPTRLEWGGSVCGDAQGFASRVSKRTRAVRFVERDERVTVRLSIEPQGTGLDAKVVLESRGRAPVIRHIASPDCDDALDALALVVAISLEARFRETGSPKSPRPPPPRAPARPVPEVAVEPGAPVVVSPPPDAPDPPPQRATVDPSSVPPTPEPGPTPEVAPEPRPARVLKPLPLAVAPTEAPAVEAEAVMDEGPATREIAAHLAFAAGASGQLLVGLAPDALIGGQAWFRARWERGSVWSPELGVSFAHQRLDGFSRPEGEADFALSSAGLDVCPLRIGTAAVHVMPCAAGSLGRLEAEGHDTYFPAKAVRALAMLGGNTQLVARFDVVELRGSLGLFRPLEEYAFRFGEICSDPDCETGIFHRADAVWLATLGAGLSFR